jgi:hypothetical protein
MFVSGPDISANYPNPLDTYTVQGENVGGTRYAYSEQQE